MSDGSADVSRRAFLRAGAGAAAVSTAAGSAAAQEGTEGGGGGNVRPEWPDYLSNANDTGYEDLRGNEEVSVSVVNNEFDPTKIWIDPGTTVTWEFEDPTHNVKPNEQPADDLQGTPGGRNDPVAEGETHEQTLETAGMYSYFCGPHESMGMKGAVAVGDDVSTVDVGGGGGGGPSVPDAAKSLGIAAAFAMAATLGLAFFFIKYGGDYGDVESA